jgi:hypothetical protein
MWRATERTQPEKGIYERKRVMEFQTTELTLDDLDNVSGGCPACVVVAAAALAAIKAAQVAAARKADCAQHAYAC